MFKYFTYLFLLILSMVNISEANDACNTPKTHTTSEIAYLGDVNDDTDLQRQSGVNINGDWDFQQGWRNYREAYFSGETQPQAYRQDHPYGRGGVGYEPDYDDYSRNLRNSEYR